MSLRSSGDAPPHSQRTAAGQPQQQPPQQGQQQQQQQNPSVSSGTSCSLPRGSNNSLFALCPALQSARRQRTDSHSTGGGGGGDSGCCGNESLSASMQQQHGALVRTGLFRCRPPSNSSLSQSLPAGQGHCLFSRLAASFGQGGGDRSDFLHSATVEADVGCGDGEAVEVGGGCCDAPPADASSMVPSAAAEGEPSLTSTAVVRCDNNNVVVASSSEPCLPPAEHNGDSTGFSQGLEEP